MGMKGRDRERAGVLYMRMPREPERERGTKRGQARVESYVLREVEHAIANE